MNAGLQDRVALVTGATDGIGLAIAERLAAEGAAVCVVSRRERKAEDVAARLAKDYSVSALAVCADVAESDAADRITRAVEAKWGRLDVLVNNAGGPPPGSFFDFDDDDWDAAVRLSLLSVVRLCKRAVPIMERHRWGRILCITSLLAKEPTSPMVLSCTTRAGVHAFCKAVSTELAPKGININCIGPGAIRTQRLEALMKKSAEREGKPYQDLVSERVASMPMGRFGEPDELANAAMMLLSEQGSFVTGQALLVDGGLSKAVH